MTLLYLLLLFLSIQFSRHQMVYCQHRFPNPNTADFVKDAKVRHMMRPDAMIREWFFTGFRDFVFCRHSLAMGFKRGAHFMIEYMLI